MCRKNFLRGGDGASHGIAAWSEDDLSTICLQKCHALYAHVFRHRENHAIALRCPDHGQPDSGVAAGGFNDGAAGFQTAFLFSSFDHAETNAVLDASTWIEGLEFHEHFGPSVLRNSVQTHHRSPTDDLTDIVVNAVAHRVSSR